MKKIQMENWKWLGNPGHFICSRDCQFHLCTIVGEYLVSTVGELWGDRIAREIEAKTIDPKWFYENSHLKGEDFDFAYMKRFGFRDIGYDRKYETMVFKAGKICDRNGCLCGVPEQASSELDFMDYKDPISANKGHMDLCKKWAQLK